MLFAPTRRSLPRCLLLAVLAGATSLADAQTPARVNLAKYQRVTASVQNSTYEPDFAVDGLVSNFHSWRTGNQTGPTWLEITYPQPVTVASAQVYLGLWETAAGAQIYGNFRFQHHNGLTWVDIPGSSVTGNMQPEVNVVFTAPVTATRFRFYSTDSGSRTLRELAFFPPNLVAGTEQGFPLGTDVRLNLAYLRPATSSSAVLNNTYGAGYAKNAFDGYRDNASRWICTSTAAGEWIEVDLLAPHALGSAHVHSGFIDPANNPDRLTTQPMSDFTLQYFDGANWLPIPGAAITGNTEVARAIEFTTPITTSKLRLLTTSASNARLQELLVFPPRTGGYALGRETIDAAVPAQTWDRYSDSTYRLRNRGPDLRLGLVDGQIVYAPPGTPISTDIEWQLLLNYRDGSYRIRHPATGLCLALADISTAAGTTVVAQEYTALPHQDWWIVEDSADTATPKRFRLVNVYSGLVLQTRNASTSAGASVVVQPANDSLTLQFWNANLQRHYPKKGIAGTNSLIRTSVNPYVTDSDLTFIEDFYRRFGGSWSYSWGRQTSDTFPYMGIAHAFSPMQWGNFNWTHGTNQGPIDNIQRDVQSNSKPVYLLGFNEPDKSEQANMTVADALARWPRLEAQQVPLVAPVPANALGTWLDGTSGFHALANSLGYRRDYTAVHWYAAPDSNAAISHLQSVYNKYGRPVWLTEFSAVRWSGTATWTERDNFNFLAEFMWRAEALTWLKRYSLFAFIQASPGVNQSAPDPAEAPRSNALRSDGSLTPFGALYAGWDGVTDVLADRAYHIHNRGVFERAQNPGGTAAPALVDPNATETGTQWFLSPGLTAGTHRLISTLDGRPLRTSNGTTVTFGTVGQTDPSVEWRLVADQHGWYFIEHPTTAKRLKDNGTAATPTAPGVAGTYTLEGLTQTGDRFKWRFVRPAVAEPAGPPASPTDLVASVSANTITLTWSAGDTTTTHYTVQRSTTGTDPWINVATDLTSPTFTDSSLAPSTSYTYRVTATNLFALTSAPSGSVTATTEAPADPYAAWTLANLGTLPIDQQLPGADPDADGMANLLEYALGTDPRATAPNPTLTAAVDGRLQLTFRRAAADLNYEVLGSSDLVTWSVIATNPGTVGESVTVSDAVTLTESPRRFLRLRVTTTSLPTQGG
ncbi:MAG: discoidin domain-containing protein [Candidatus Didemnitutus sp.]|nr:discoidin domain-containing protein [Candidatus Didemnitutus sp.]